MDRYEERRPRPIKLPQWRSKIFRVMGSATSWALLWSIAVVVNVPRVGWAQHAHGTQTSTPAVGAPAIDFELKLLDGISVSLKGFRGKPLVVNFFASWCDPCRDEMPVINEVASAADKAGYSVIGIAVEDTRAAVTEFAKDAKLGFPVALDLNSTVKRAYRIFGPPATFFIDRQGVVREVVLGPVTRERARDALRNAGVATSALEKPR